mmetsp:Transcript_29515/g.94774  ORF Transcript_29515/g.94774 Transcript_29515/m.94774 type:complete len:406 (+) Transcript_29515:1653-2870(+)
MSRLGLSLSNPKEKLPGSSSCSPFWPSWPKNNNSKRSRSLVDDGAAVDEHLDDVAVVAVEDELLEGVPGGVVWEGVHGGVLHLEVDEERVELLARREASNAPLQAEALGAAHGGEVEHLGDGQRLRGGAAPLGAVPQALPQEVVQVALLRGSDGLGRDDSLAHAVQHRGRVAAGHVRAEPDLDALGEHLLHVQHAGAEAEVRVGAVHDARAGVVQNLALLAAAVAAVRHVGHGRPLLRLLRRGQQAVVVVDVGVGRALRVQRAHPRDLRQRLPQVRLHGHAVARRDVAEAGEHLRRARRHEPRRDHGRHKRRVVNGTRAHLVPGALVGRLGRGGARRDGGAARALERAEHARLLPRLGLERPAHELLGVTQPVLRGLHVVLRAVAVHAHLANVGALPRAAHDVHE